ncbi:FMN-binding glutamate synthase family protein [Sulfurovum sp.]|uniref:FMN-binding glutamate synthase family protein n=1 Tax=Sulfurovum sp. TaxID=1969726 RepID=UPI0025EEA7FA|nr:FMN-binding glutamate synthase family protein [Sulfurovum sp.]
MLAKIWVFLEIVTPYVLSLFFLGLIVLFIYDRYIQRKHSLLVNYPVIGRFRYLFEALREPLRQYFAEENFYESRDKVDWVYKAAKDVPNYKSFSVDQPFSEDRFIVKHATNVLNDNEVSDDMTVTYGKTREYPYVGKTPIIRSAMSDGALSPEAVRAFSLGAALSGYTLNTGEGGLTSNHLYTLNPAPDDNVEYLEIIKSTPLADIVFKMLEKFVNRTYAIKAYRKVLLNKRTANTYIYGQDANVLFRVNWKAPLSAFPKEIPASLPDMIFQMSSGLYGVRDEHGNFDEERYAKVMTFCRMTEIKIAQGAKQTGGKLAGTKVTADIAYYRGVEEGKDLFSPNRFPYADTPDHLLDFIGRLQEISKKPVGVKIVISDENMIDKLAERVAERKKEGLPVPDFITVDSGEGGSATAPLELMESVGLNTVNALYVLDSALRRHGLKDDIKIIISGKILTPDDVIIMLSLGADAVGIARGFMMSGGCIRARMCSGYGSHKCPVGMATQDPKKRASYMVVKQAYQMSNYHNNLIKGMKMMLAVMGFDHKSKLGKKNLTFRNRNGEIFFDVEEYFKSKLHIYRDH